MTKEQLLNEAQAGRLPRSMTIALWKCRGRDVTLTNSDMNQLVLESKSDENLEFLMEQLKVNENEEGSDRRAEGKTKTGA